MHQANAGFNTRLGFAGRTVGKSVPAGQACFQLCCPGRAGPGAWLLGRLRNCASSTGAARVEGGGAGGGRSPRAWWLAGGFRAGGRYPPGRAGCRSPCGAAASGPDGATTRHHRRRPPRRRCARRSRWALPSPRSACRSPDLLRAIAETRAGRRRSSWRWVPAPRSPAAATRPGAFGSPGPPSRSAPPASPAPHRARWSAWGGVSGVDHPGQVQLPRQTDPLQLVRGVVNPPATSRRPSGAIRRSRVSRLSDRFFVFVMTGFLSRGSASFVEVKILADRSTLRARTLPRCVCERPHQLRVKFSRFGCMDLPPMRGAPRAAAGLSPREGPVAPRRCRRRSRRPGAAGKRAVPHCELQAFDSPDLATWRTCVIIK
jgi:hypothetical protein